MRYVAMAAPQTDNELSMQLPPLKFGNSGVLCRHLTSQNHLSSHTRSRALRTHCVATTKVQSPTSVKVPCGIARWDACSGATRPNDLISTDRFPTSGLEFCDWLTWH